MVDQCIYHKFSESKFVFLILYVDDILFASNDKNMMRKTKKFLFKHFGMKDLGETSYMLGLKIHRDQNNDILGLSQHAYIDKILKHAFIHQLIRAKSLFGNKIFSFMCAAIFFLNSQHVSARC
jgi:Reverse transcriptase (RNA-dependent DNA polymerase)